MRYLLCSLVVASIGAAPALADLRYQLADSAGLPQSSFTIASVGGTVDVRLYIAQDGGTTTLNPGLIAAGVRLNYDAPAGIGRVAGLGDISFNPQWTGAPPGTLTADASSARLNVLGLIPVTPDAGGRIWIGTMRLTGLSMGSSVLIGHDPDPTFIDTGTLSGLFIDDLLAPATATLQVLPAPASAAAFASLLLVPRRRKSSRR